MNTLTDRNHAVNIAAAKTQIGVQRPLSKTETIAETDKYIFTVYDSGQSRTFRIANKKQSGARPQDLLVGANEFVARKQWKSLIETGEMKRL